MVATRILWRRYEHVLACMCARYARAPPCYDAALSMCIPDRNSLLQLLHAWPSVLEFLSKFTHPPYHPLSWLQTLRLWAWFRAGSMAELCRANPWFCPSSTHNAWKISTCTQGPITWPTLLGVNLVLRKGDKFIWNAYKHAYYLGPALHPKGVTVWVVVDKHVCRKWFMH